MGQENAICGCATERALRDVLQHAPAAIVQVRLLPVASMFPRDLRDAVSGLPYAVTCVVAPPEVAGLVATDEPARLGQALVFAGRQLLGRLEVTTPNRVDVLLGLLRAGLSPRLPAAGWDDETADPWSVLGVSSTATLDEVRDAWHRQVSQHHPDRFMQADEQRQRQALESSQRYNAAFRAIRRVRDGEI